MSVAPILLYTFETFNEKRVSIFLEELNATYGLQYEKQEINLRKSVQKEPWFLEINPNGKIPAIVDRSRNDFKVFETSAILLYLQQHHDTENKFGFDPVKEADDYSEALQWIFFVHGGVSPMQSQLIFFNVFSSEKIPYAINRYLEETKRLYGVLEIRLKERDWLVGPGRGKYTIADMNVLPVLKSHAFSGIESLDQWPNVKAWVKRADEKPGFATIYKPQ